MCVTTQSFSQLSIVVEDFKLVERLKAISNLRSLSIHSSLSILTSSHDDAANITLPSEITSFTFCGPNNKLACALFARLPATIQTVEMDLGKFYSSQMMDAMMEYSRTIDPSLIAVPGLWEAAWDTAMQ